MRKSFPHLLLSLIVISFLVLPVEAQKKGRSAGQKTRISTPRPQGIGAEAVVMDERLSVLRAGPGFYADTIQRMRVGRKVRITGVAEVDGTKFFRVSALPGSMGWVQADAVFGTFREQDETRLVNLLLTSKGFEQIEQTRFFLDLYPRSKHLPNILLLLGDLVEQATIKLSKDARSRLDENQMLAVGAPRHTFFLNFVSLDRYKKLGIDFLFNHITLQYHYDGWSWKKIIRDFPNSAEANDARERLETLEKNLALRSKK